MYFSRFYACCNLFKIILVDVDKNLNFLSEWNDSYLRFILFKCDFSQFFGIWRGVGEKLAQILDALLGSGVLIPAIWISLGFVTAWFLLSAKRVVPLSRSEAETLWKIHKQKALCNGEKWNTIDRGDKIVGFECDCGYEHIQKKHIITINV